MRDTLAAQARLIWPFEEPLLPDEPGRLLDLACGTGEFLRRVRPRCSFAVGVDLFAGHLRFAEGPVACGNGLQLPFADATFDTVAVRHVLQALPDPVPLLSEARRVLRPGGRLHLLAEDYQGLFFDGPDVAVENHFAEVAPLVPRARDGSVPGVVARGVTCATPGASTSPCAPCSSTTCAETAKRSARCSGTGVRATPRRWRS